MGCRRRLARTTLEVDDGDDLQLLAVAAMRHILLEIRSTMLVEITTQFHHLLGGVRATARARQLRRRALAFEMELLDMVLGDAEVLGNLSQREVPEALHSVRWVLFQPKHVQLVGDEFALFKDFLVKLKVFDEDWCHVHILPFSGITLFSSDLHLKRDLDAIL